MLRGHAGEPTHVVVLATEHAPARGGRGRRRRRRPRPIGPQPAPAAVSTTRATLIAARAFGDEREAVSWLERVDAEAEVAAAIAALNGLLHLHRTATADPTVREIGRRQALVARIGVGEGEQVADGRFARALELPLPPVPRHRGAALRPTVEAVAASALEGGVDDERTAQVAHALGRLEAALRARSAVGLD